MVDKALRVAVVGVGHFGRIHASKYAANPHTHLVAVADSDPARAEAVAREFGVAPVTDYRDLAGRVDAASVAVPTPGHHEVASFLLKAGIHVLIEKPITAEVAQADDLIALARERGLVLQVGHLVRFFAKDAGLLGEVHAPQYIEVVRIAPFGARGSDVSVVLDLMIHDIDLIVALVRSRLTRVDAVGTKVLSDHEDIVNARLEFENGCVASLTASRVAYRQERRMRIFQPNHFLNVDTLNGRITSVSKPPGMVFRPGADLLSSGFDVSETEISEHDALEAEIAAFAESVASGRPPLVTGEDGRAALDIAHRILDSLQARAELVRAHAEAANG